jgi:tetratricopeptide (TPR) repeat protein
MRLCLPILLLSSFFSASARGQAVDPVEQYSQQGQQALAQGNYPAAQAAFEKLRELEPGVAEIHANLGLIYFQEKKFSEAVVALRQAARLKPNLTRTAPLLAMSLSELGKFDEALPGLEKCFHGPSDASAKRMCGLQLMRAETGKGRDAQAVAAALELKRLYPGDPEILYHTGKIFGNYAYLTMQDLWHVGADSIWRHQAAAEAYESQGSFDPALSEYRAVLAIDPNRPGIHYRIGRTLLARKLKQSTTQPDEEAAREFEAELNIEPNNANAAYELAEISRKGGQLDRAQELFDRALKLHPDFGEAQLGLAAVFVSQNKAAEALPHLQRAVAIDPQNEVAWYRLSLVQRSLGNAADQQKAMAEFKRLHESAGQPILTRDIMAPAEVTKQEIDPQ